MTIAGCFDLIEVQVLEFKVDIGAGVAALVQLHGNGVSTGFKVFVWHNELTLVRGATIGPAVDHVAALALFGEVQTAVVESFDAFPVDVDNGCIVVAQRPT